LIGQWISKFLKGFWKQSKACISGQEVKALADICKARRNDLARVVSEFIAGKAPAFPGDYYIIEKNPVKLVSLNYYPNSFKGLLNYMEELQEILSFLELSQPPGFYVYLHKILFHLIASFDLTEDDYEKNKTKIILLLNLTVSLGQVYEHMNPTPDVMESYGLDLLNQLRQESKEPSDDFWSLFKEVAKDIHSPPTPKNRYVHDIIYALRKLSHHCDTHFQYKDYYLTAKAATSKVTIDHQNIKLNALYSSIIEYDPLVGQPAIDAFDNLIGYQSGYMKKFDIPQEVNGKCLETEQQFVITQMIPNPGKYKPRGIHVGCNSIQDRCKYLHRILAFVLNSISSCCMNQHFRGVEFLMEVTRPSYRMENQNNVFVSDFSNATDTLNQEFQCQVIKVLFNDTYSEFWRFISKLPKTFRHPKDNTLEPYEQMTGQPQGLLASFDAFSLAHIYLICMLMKRFHLEQRELSKTLAIVGDDSVVSYPSGLELEESEGHTFYTFHSWLCEEVSLIKNESKTGKSFFDGNGNYSHEILDFAKISIQDGEFVTPLPFGLAAAYANKPGDTDLQVYFWLNSKGVTYKTLVYKKLFNAYYKQLDQLIAASSVLSSGEIPFLEKFQDEEVFNSIDSSIRGVSLYAFYLNQLEHTFLSSILSENRKDCLQSENFLNESLASLEKDFYNFNKELGTLIPMLPVQHKYNVMLKQNMQLADDIQTVLDVKDNKEDLIGLLTILTTDEYSALFKQMLTFKEGIDKSLEENSEDIWQYFCYQDFSFYNDLSRSLQSMQVKSMKKLSSNTTIIMKSAARKTHRIISKSQCLEDLKQDKLSKFVDTILKVAAIEE
jgi:hypothetical protein